MNKLDSVVFFVEATSFESFCLWKEHRTIWKEDNQGFAQIIGYINEDTNMPINVSFQFAEFYGKRIAFYEIVSRFSDSVKVDEWLISNYPLAKTNRTDAQNFHIALHHVQP